VKSVFDGLSARAILRLAGHDVPGDKKLMHCLFHADKHPSLSILERGFKCHACGSKGGLIDLAIAVGFGYDPASAARDLEKRLRG
jgi:hypothetical protein